MNWRERITSLAVGSILCVLLPGCGDDAPYELAPVSGVVTLDGKPVPYTQIVFVPTATPENPNPGPGSAASCDETGKFELRTVRGEAGAVVGPHTVQVSSKGPPRTTSGDVDAGPPAKDAFPPRFNVSSELTFPVPAEGTTTADFKLTTSP